MEIPVLIEPLPNGQGFEARAGEPFAVTVRAPSEHEALSKLEAAVRARVTGRAKLLTLTVNTGNPMIPSGFLPDDQFTRDWMESIAEYRRQKNDEPDPWELTPEGRAALGHKEPEERANQSPEGTSGSGPK
jgi:hypothetical protein